MFDIDDFGVLEDASGKDTSRYSGVPIALPKAELSVPYIVTKPGVDGITDYDIYIVGTIDIGNVKSFEAYNDIIRILKYATEDTKINIIIDTMGGDIQVGCLLASAMRASAADITTVATGYVMSMGTVIWHAGKKRIVRDSAIFMYHFSSHGDAGSSISINAISQMLVDYVTDVLIMPSLRDGMITDSEYDRIVKREDIYISGVEMNRRLSS